MKKIVSFLVCLIFIGQATAADPGIAEQLFVPNAVQTELLNTGLTPSGKPSFNAAMDEDNSLKPGKALVLSAIIPGAGQFYAGQPLKGVMFFALEVAAWTGVIYYYNQGQEKEDEYEAFADKHFHETVYRDVEFQLARDAGHGQAGAYPDDDTHDFNTWTREDWDEKIKYLPGGGFTHELPTEEARNVNSSHLQQFYEMIGKYIHQFGFGWDDVWSDPQNPVLGTFIGDDPSTGYFDNIDGAAGLSRAYMDMRYESNQFLDYSAYAMQISLLNHVASALEASFTVRRMNRTAAKAEVGFRQVWYDNHPMAVGGLKITW